MSLATIHHLRPERTYEQEVHDAALEMLNELTADDLWHLASLRRAEERRQAEARAAYLADLLWRPALGAYRALQLARAVTWGPL